jgi:hypothetical protein
MRTHLIAAAALAVAVLPSAADATVVLYQFDDPTDLGRDTSGFGNNAVNFGASFAAAGYQGGAALFKGTDWMQASVDVNRAVRPKMTWGAWVKPTVGGAADQAVLSNDDGGFDRQIGIDFRSGPTGWSAFTGSGVLNSGLAPSTSAWTFLAAVYDQSQYSMTYYVNDQSYTTQTNFGGSPATFAVGRNPTFSSFYSGLVDNVFVYDEALGAGQIANLRATGFPSNSPPVSAVPEPSTWAMMLLGFGAIGYSMRKRPKHRLPHLA